jgi:hypothetical protein
MIAAFAIHNAREKFFMPADGAFLKEDYPDADRKDTA